MSSFVVSFISCLFRKSQAASQWARSHCQILILCLTGEVGESARAKTQECQWLTPPHPPGQLQGRAARSSTSITWARELRWPHPPDFGEYRLWGGAPQIGGGNHRQSQKPGRRGGRFSRGWFIFGNREGGVLSKCTWVSQFKTVAAVPDEPKRT